MASLDYIAGQCKRSPGKTDQGHDEADRHAGEDQNEQRQKTDDAGEKAVIWGEGEFSVSVFHNLTYAEEKAVIDEAAAWTQKKAEVGYHKISWEPEFGGMGLTKEHEKVFARLEAEYITPGGHETHSVTIGLMAPTIRLLGSERQKKDWVDRWARCDFEQVCPHGDVTEAAHASD